MTGVDEAESLVGSYFGSSASAEPVRDGVNTLHIVSTDSGCYVVKFGTFNPELVRLEHLLLVELEKENVPVPSVHDWGEVQNGVPYFIADYISGRQLPYSHEMEFSELLKYAGHLGEVLARIQNISVPVGEIRNSGDSLVSSTDVSWSVFFRQFLAEQAEDAGKNYGELSSKAKQLVYWADVPELENGSCLNPVDLHTHNMIVSDNTVVGVIDFERGYGGHESWGFEVTKHMLTMTRSRSEKRRVVEKFKDGYKNVASSVPNEHAIMRVAAAVREMRAAHIWWDNPEGRRDDLETILDSAEDMIREES